jgi:spore germination protein YaaH
MFNCVSAQATTTSMEKLWYLKNEERSMASFEKNIGKIDIVGPQTYFLLNNGEVRNNFPEKILKLKNEKNQNLKVMPLLANITFYYSPSPSGRAGEGVQKEYFDQAKVVNLLDDKNNWQKISDYMRMEAKKNSFWGWQLDLENIPASHKEKFSEFVKFLKSEFDKDGLKLTVAVVSKISDEEKDYGKEYWGSWAGAYDWKVLSDNTEFLSIMAYDQPESPGPVATLGWSKKVLDYALKTIPKEKISFGIPVYAWVYRSEDLKKRKKAFYND